MECYLLFTHNKGKESFFTMIKSLDLNNGQPLENIEDSKSLCFTGPKMFKVGMSPGAIFKAETEDFSRYTYKAKDFPVGKWKNENDLVRFRSYHAANQAKEETLKEIRTNDLSERLRPIREVYRVSSPTKKANLLAAIIREITK